jgi:YjbE family integral membrane protein
MNTSFLLSAFQIIVINLVMSADNVGAIALAIRNLPKELNKKANLIGLLGAFLIRLVLCCFTVEILQIVWLPIRLVGGLLLLYITWNFINPKEEEQEASGSAEASEEFAKAVKNIIIADLSMSLDNVLAMSGAANGNLALVGIGLAVTFPIIFFGSELVSSLMQKHKIVIYIGAAVLLHTALSMILEDNLLAGRVNGTLSLSLPWIAAAGLLIYGVIAVKKQANLNNC